EPQLVMVQVTVKAGTVATPAVETVPASLVAHNNATSPDALSRTASYVKVQGPVTISDTMPALFQDLCDRTPDGGAAETIYRGVLATAGGVTLALQLGGISYCRTQCLQTCS